MNNKPQKQIVAETGLDQATVSRELKNIREGKNLLRKNVANVAKSIGIKNISVEVE